LQIYSGSMVRAEQGSQKYFCGSNAMSDFHFDFSP